MTLTLIWIGSKLYFFHNIWEFLSNSWAYFCTVGRSIRAVSITHSAMPRDFSHLAKKPPQLRLCSRESSWSQWKCHKAASVSLLYYCSKQTDSREQTSCVLFTQSYFTTQLTILILKGKPCWLQKERYCFYSAVLNIAHIVFQCYYLARVVTEIWQPYFKLLNFTYKHSSWVCYNSMPCLGPQVWATRTSARSAHKTMLDKCNPYLQ